MFEKSTPKRIRKVLCKGLLAMPINVSLQNRKKYDKDNSTVMSTAVHSLPQNTWLLLFHLKLDTHVKNWNNFSHPWGRTERAVTSTQRWAITLKCLLSAKYSKCFTVSLQEVQNHHFNKCFVTTFWTHWTLKAALH